MIPWLKKVFNFLQEELPAYTIIEPFFATSMIDKTNETANNHQVPLVQQALACLLRKWIIQ